MAAWWKKTTSGNNNNNGQDQPVASGYQGNPMPTVMTPENIGTVNNNVFLKGYDRFINEPGVQTAEAPQMTK